MLKSDKFVISDLDLVIKDTPHDQKTVPEEKRSKLPLLVKMTI
jgi:hypothetical protein